MSNPTEQLKLLREFVGTSVYTETSLVDCLRQANYNVERAADMLLTGSYRPSKSNNHSTISISSTNVKRSSQKPMAKPSEVPAPAGTSISHIRPRKPSPIPTTTPRVSLESQYSIPDHVDYDQDVDSNKQAWLLAERWISECLCNCRHGTIRYREVLTLTHTKTGPPCIRFKGNAAEGTLPVSLATLMVPLLRYPDEYHKDAPGNPSHSKPLLLLRAESLYEDNHLSTGSLVPIRLRIYLPNPREFFALFSQDTDGAVEQATNSNLFERRGAKNKRRLPITEAAFGLLQYAEYGDVPQFDLPVVNHEEVEEEISDEVQEDDESEVVNEEAKELDNQVLSKALDSKQLPEADDPPGFAPGITLRPYQRQALYWMRQRETRGESRAEQDEQLALIRAMADYDSDKHRVERPYASEKENRATISCDCGPVMVSEQAKTRSRTIDGHVNPASHPLWQQRFLASPSMKETLTFYVNEIFRVATHQPPEPPKSCSGGILADEMGLGKTVIVLALILQEKAERLQQTEMVLLDAPTTSLVVVKLSLLQQWEQEIKTKTNLSVYVYHDCAGPQTIRKTSAAELARVDIVLTTYAVLQGEIKRKQPTLLRFPWLRVVLDEAHSIKNHQTLAAKAACDLNTIYRWACTGTIVLNGLDDVFGLMKFLKHEPWCWPSFWKAAVTKPWNSGNVNEHEDSEHQKQKENIALVLDRVRKLLGPILIRRTKDMVQLDLPPVDTRVIRVDFTEAERVFYDAVLERSHEIFEDFMDKGAVEKSYLKILSMISRLRQTCNHMFLTVRSKIDEETIAEIEEDSTKTPSKSKHSDSDDDALGRDFFENLLRKVQAASSPRKNKADGSPESPRKRAKDNSYLSQIVQDLTTAVRVNSTHVQDECPICLETPLIEKAAISPCGHIFCKDCLIQYLRDRSNQNGPSKSLHVVTQAVPNGECPCCNKPIKARRIIELTKAEAGDGTQTYTSKYLNDIDKGTNPLKIHREVLETQEGNSSALARQMLNEAVAGVDKDSSKMKAVMTELQNVWKVDPGSKVIIFSHYLGFLDLLSTKLQSEGIASFRFDGSLTAKERFEVLKGFSACQSGNMGFVAADGTSKGSVLLMSMTAGAEGLNLMVASTCFIVEPWWNSAKEDQCINRIHRIGQMAPVVRVRKFIVNDSVEEQIMKMQKCKKGIADELYSDAGNNDMSGTRLSLDDFKLIFRSRQSSLR